MSRQLSLCLLLATSMSCRHAQVAAEDDEPAPTDRTKAGFPTQQALANLAAQETPTEKLDEAQGLEVEHWALTGPFPSGWNEAHPGDQPLAAELASELQKSGAKMGASFGMHCTSREVALFYLANTKMPTGLLREFIGARCHATDTLFGYRSTTWKVEKNTDPKKLLEAAKASVAQMFGALPPDAKDLGIWFGQKGEIAVAILAYGKPRALLSAVTVEGDSLKISGKALQEVANLRAVVTRGEFGYAECEATLKAADFTVTCPIASADQSAMVDISGAPPGRWVATTLTSVIQPLASASPEYSGWIASTTSTAAPTQANLLRGLRAEIARARKQSGLPPLTFEKAQSDGLSSVTGHYFAGSQGLMPAETVDLVAMGAQAGWLVDGKVQRGNFASSASQSGGGLSYLVGAMLARPVGRSVVFDPEASRLAIGAYAGKQSFSGAIVSTYRLLDPRKEAALERTAWEELVKARAAFGKAAPKRLDPLGEELLTELRNAPTANAQKVLNAWLNQGAHHYLGRQVRGWAIELDGLETTAFPQELLEAAELECVFMVAHYRPRYEPWSRFVVFVMVPSYTTAFLSGGGGGLAP
jgi:hypothetical protein